MTGDLNETIGIALVDDHRLSREGIREILSAEHDFKVVAEGESAAEASGLAAEYQPDILLLAVQISQMNPAMTIRQVTKASPSTRIVVLSTHSDDYLIPSMTAGAAAFLSKDIGGRELCGILRSIAANGQMFAARVPRHTALRRENVTSAPIALTDREIEILRLVSIAMSNSQIAMKLYISEATVKRHLTNIFTKLTARSRLGAVNRAITLGLLEGFDSRPYQEAIRPESTRAGS